MESEIISEPQEIKFKILKEWNVSLQVALIAITVALYIALGYIFQSISFLGLQFRVAELIVGI